MRLRRLALAAVLVAAVFTTVIALTFPTELVLRRVLAQVTPPGGPRLDFARAALRPWGLRLDGVTLRNPDGSIVAAAEWLRVRPSLMGFVRDRTGRPWRAHGGTCGGAVEATVDGDAGGSTMVLGWRDLDLANCELVAAGGALEGRTEGAANLRLTPGAPLAGDGNAQVHAATLRMQGLRLPFDALHADPAHVRWALLENKITLSAIELQGPELHVTGTGTVRLQGTLADSALNLRLVVTPGPEAPPGLLDALTNLPPARDAAPGAKLLLVVGTITELRRLI